MTTPRLALAGYLLIAGCWAFAGDRARGYSLIAGSVEECSAIGEIVDGGTHPDYVSLGGLGHFSPLKHELDGSVLATRVRDFDFDNDGVADQVYYREESTNYQDATLWYVFRGPLADVGDQPRDPATLTVYPCQFDPAVARSSSCPPFSQDADEARVDVRVDGFEPTVSFRVRYTYALPIFTGRKTLLMLKSVSIDSLGNVAVIEPTGDRAFRSLCIFKRRTA